VRDLISEGVYSIVDPGRDQLALDLPPVLLLLLVGELLPALYGEYDGVEFEL
jgi:hypothetical protein